MKLPDFTHHAGFNSLREEMGADLIELELVDPEWTRLSIQLEQEGIDVSFDEVEVQSDSTFEYKGQKVVVYIRDQHGHIIDRGSEYKFHLAQCQTLNDMQSRNRHGRYVVTNRKDGKFVVNVLRKTGSEMGIEKSMRLCKNCATALNMSAQDFNLAQFFAKYSSRIKKMPRHTEKTAPLNDYSDDWREIANKMKSEQGFRCELCRRSFMSSKQSLHVHHIDGDKSNNHRYNLQVLCEECHSKQPGHEHMKAARFSISMLPAQPGELVSERSRSKYGFSDTET